MQEPARPGARKGWMDMKTINKLGTVIRGIMIQQIIKTYQETKGAER